MDAECGGGGGGGREGAGSAESDGFLRGYLYRARPQAGSEQRYRPINRSKQSRWLLLSHISNSPRAPIRPSPPPPCHPIDLAPDGLSILAITGRWTCKLATSAPNRAPPASQAGAHTRGARCGPFRKTIPLPSPYAPMRALSDTGAALSRTRGDESCDDIRLLALWARRRSLGEKPCFLKTTKYATSLMHNVSARHEYTR